MTAERHPFVAVAYDRADLKLRRQLNEVTRIESIGGDPGEVIEIDFEWPTPDYPPQKLIWKAPPEHSLVWELQAFDLDGRPMLMKPGMFA
jgi:hypothetical protein